jgi:Sigma-70 region 2
MEKTIPRNRSTRYEDHEPLLRKKAKLYYSRLLAAQIMSVEYEDVLSELGIAFTRAAKGYDPESQYVFTTYLGTCCQNHFNKYAARLMLEQFGTERQRDIEEHMSGPHGLGYISIESLSSEGNFIEQMSDDGATQEEQLDARLSIAQIIDDASLLPETRAYIGLLVNPDLKMSDTVRARIHNRRSDIKREIQARWGVNVPTLNL